MQNLDPLPRPDLLEATISRCGGSITTTDVRKAMQMIFKAKLVSLLGRNDDGETLWQIPAVSEEAMLRRVDQAMVVRLESALDELGKPLEHARIPPLCLAERTDSDIDALIVEAKHLIADHSDDD